MSDKLKPDDLTQPQRRQFIQHLVRAMGVTTATALVYGSNLNVAMGYQIRTNAKDTAGVLFDQPMMLTLKHVANTILPRTNTPSGADLDCHGFVDNQLFRCHSESEQRTCIDILKDIEEYSVNKYQLSFSQLDAQKQQKTLQSLEALDGFNKFQKNQFTLLKSLIIFGYFTSEVGAKEILRYDPVPGGFSVIPLKENDKVWGSLAYY